MCVPTRRRVKRASATATATGSTPPPAAAAGDGSFDQPLACVVAGVGGCQKLVAAVLTPAGQPATAADSRAAQRLAAGGSDRLCVDGWHPGGRAARRAAADPSAGGVHLIGSAHTADAPARAAS